MTYTGTTTSPIFYVLTANGPWECRDNRLLTEEEVAAMAADRPNTIYFAA